MRLLYQCHSHWCLACIHENMIMPCNTNHSFLSWMQVQVWDTAGQERFMLLLPMYLRQAKCVMVTFDTSKRNSLERCRKTFEFVKKNIPKDCIVALVGTKSDCKQASIVEDGRKIARSMHMMFGITSAKKGEGVTSIFERIVRKSLGFKVDDDDDDGGAGGGASSMIEEVHVHEPGSGSESDSKRLINIHGLLQTCGWG
eukprot:TRINITY_DN1145_c0_g2_i1.p1 TRINITY_DN1145_c0_g2~~TRINITY_DN1145_c0_g2_i1.p1  ORF type:complete len:199 (-),score=54.41 TRINITY_DN1145_c0_g2_i1:58-654(-)